MNLIVRFPVMLSMSMLMGSVFTFMGMIMFLWDTYVCMGMSMFVKMFVSVNVIVLMRVNEVSMLVFMSMGIDMRV